MSVSEARKKANAKWNASQDSITIRIPKEDGALIRNTSASMGMSITQFIWQAVLFYISSNDMMLHNEKKDEK